MLVPSYASPPNSVGPLTENKFFQGGDTFARRGYWGDIIASPYLAFGLHTDNEELLKTHGGKYIKVGGHGT